MTINQSDFETAHTKKFNQFGKQTLKLDKGKKKILIIGPQSDLSAAERSFMAPALGVIRLAGYLNKNGHYAEHYEPNIHMLTNEGISLEEMLKKFEWDVIGFSVLEETLVNDIKNMYLANRIVPKSIIIAGGIEAQFNYQTLLDKTPCKVVFISEAEKSLLKFLNGDDFKTIPGMVFKNNSLPLDQHTFDFATSAINWEELPYERYWDYYLKKYGNKLTKQNEYEIHTVRIFSRNRCPIGCKFCSSTNQITWGAGAKVPVISASEDTLIHNIKRVVEAHPRVKTIYLTDDDFCIVKKSVIRFCQKVIDEKFNDLTFMAFCRASDANEEMFFWMKKANFRRLNIGIESFSFNVLNEMNKRCTPEQNHECLELAKKHNIPAFLNIIVTTPKTTLEDVEETVSSTIKYAKDPFFHVGVTLGIKPLKGTEYFETFTNFRSRTVKLPGTDYTVKIDDLIYSEDPRVKMLQIRYWNEIDEYISKEIKKKDIKHNQASNLSLLKLNFLMKLVNEIKNKKFVSKSSIIDEKKSEPFNERQTVDVEIEDQSKKSNKKSKFGGWT